MTFFFNQAPGAIKFAELFCCKARHAVVLTGAGFSMPFEVLPPAGLPITRLNVRAAINLFEDGTALITMLLKRMLHA